MKVLIIKLTSMGDVIHLFPALTDAKKHIPNIEFDWVIDQSFTELPKWHAAVKDIIPVSLRNLRKNFIKGLLNGKFLNTFKQIRQKNYDLIIDAQGLFKSAVIAKMAKGKKAGCDLKSARERLASFFYDEKYSVDFNQHAVTRMRKLFASALNYTIDSDIPDYGLTFQKQENHRKFIVFLHGTTWPHKHWPENYWRELAEFASQQNIEVDIPWGTEEEKLRAQKIANNLPTINVLPKMKLTELANYLVNAKACVAVDTGLAHLSAALDIPTISLYGPTSAELTGTRGKNQIHINAKFECAPCLKRKCFYKGPVKTFPACFSTITAESVWSELKKHEI